MIAAALRVAETRTQFPRTLLDHGVLRHFVGVEPTGSRVQDGYINIVWDKTNSLNAGNPGPQNCKLVRLEA